jgi:hypothetical protein
MTKLNSELDEEERAPMGTCIWHTARMFENAKALKRQNTDLADECHVLKNSCSAGYKIVCSRTRESLLLVSATPLANHIRDIHRYMELI